MSISPLPTAWTHRTPRRMWSDAGAGGRASQWLYVLSVLTRHEFRNRYRAQALGVAWSLINPIVTMFLLNVVFARAFQARTPNLQVFLLIALIPWNFVNNVCHAVPGAFIVYSDLVKRTVFPRQLLPLAMLGGYVLNLMMKLCVLVIFIPIWPQAYTFSPALLLVPVLLASLVVILAGVSLMVSVLNVIYRDVGYLVNTALLMLYWVTPVVYPVDIIPEPWQKLIRLNPLTGLFDALRGCIMTGSYPDLATWGSILVPMVLVFTAGWFMFQRYEKMVLDHV